MVALGIEELLTHRRDLLRGRRVGLVSNYGVTDAAFRPVIRLLADSGEWELAKLFGPEHGVRNCAKEGEKVGFSIDEATGIPAYSLYGDDKRPSLTMLEGLDVLVIDLPDIGCRYYTNMNTLAYCMEACASSGIPCVVLDRPNPLGGIKREGIILQPTFSSFVGMHPIPNRHGLTMGELAQFINARLPQPCHLTIVPMSGWTRDMMHPDTGLPFVSSSPNTTDLAMAVLYPGTCLFEGTNVSVGRGTTHPFEWIGAPFMKAHSLADWLNSEGVPGVVARPVYFVPTYSTHTGEVCEGIALHITDIRALDPVFLGVKLLQGVAAQSSGQFAILGGEEKTMPFLDLLAGSDHLRRYLLEGHAMDYLEEAKGDLERFNDEILPYELYRS
ncbi:MAG: DUF1343 domain-containing protein [Firmicutes bacterium]|nr:DUF1343 domain-containing protein [Bacillota bacterium]